ncbi:MAG: zinc ribbon domain-containing protein [Candidatus Latescibacteria bacterium]|nr:zinc ribbon domain-containing protein [Candidatus Latescibacterota bacterium]
MISFLCLLIAVGVMVYVGRPLFTQQGVVAATARRKSRHAVLMEQRDALYAAIRELDFDHRMGKVDDEDYRRMRGDYTQQAVSLLKEVDRGNGRSRAADDVEQEVASFRKKGGQVQAQVAFCSSCGVKVRPNDRFCARCGSKVGDE